MNENQTLNKPSNQLPTHAQVVIIGGGVIGCSSATKIDMAKYTLELYAQLEEETGQATGFNPLDMITIACKESRLEELRRVSAFCRHFDVSMEELSPTEVQDLWPMMDSSDVLAGFLSAGDGRVNPVDVTMALAKGARNGGVRIFEGTKVTAIKKRNNRVAGVVTDKGEIDAEYVVNCAGIWAGEVGRLAGVNIPLQAAEHYYLITEPIEGVTADLPVLVDPDRYAYYREEIGGFLLGVFEPVAAPWSVDGIPEGFSFGEIPPDWDRMIPFLEPLMDRIPVVREAGIHKFFCGPESFTADDQPLLGETPELGNFFVAAGLNSLGILLAGGVGKVMADWIVNGVPDVDINIRKSAFHDRMVAANAYFGCYAGWEYPDWFAPKGVEPKVEYSWGRQNWFEYSAAEHRAAREGVTLMDYSVMGKILVQGRDAEKYLNYICANDIAVPVGRCVYTQWLNETGTIEADLTVTRLADDLFLVLTGDKTTNQAQAWLRRHIPADAHVFITNITSAYSVLSIQGPKSRDLLSSVTHVDMSNEAFPFLTMQEIDIGYALVKALRITYVGELGWELYIPTEFSLHVFDTLVEKGQDFGLKLIGLQALESLRLEKAYRDYGGDIDNTDTPLEVGLGRFVRFDKPGGFIGRDALLRLQETGYRYLMPQFLLEDGRGGPCRKQGRCRHGRIHRERFF